MSVPTTATSRDGYIEDELFELVQARLTARSSAPLDDLQAWCQEWRPGLSNTSSALIVYILIQRGLCGCDAGGPLVSLSKVGQAKR